MGVTGLQTFLYHQKQNGQIKIKEKIDQWKRENPKRGKPTIVIDFLSLCNSISTRFFEENICGGRPFRLMGYITMVLESIEKLGCKLVFFTDCNIQGHKKEEWLRRRNSDFDGYTELYGWIERGEKLWELAARTNMKAVTSTFYGMEEIAKFFGENFQYAVKYECDLEIVQYANKKENNVMAILSNDTDFHIFNGPWWVWSNFGYKYNIDNMLNTYQYKNDCVKNACSDLLVKHQLPLFATLLGNDFTQGYHKQLRNFFSSHGTTKELCVYEKCKTCPHVMFVAEYVGINYPQANLSDADIKKITMDVLGQKDAKMHQLIKQSIDFYNLKTPPTTTDYLDNGVGKRLKRTSMYSSYISMMSPIQGVNLNYYDMRGCDGEVNFILPKLLVSWLRRKIGVLRKNRHDDSFTFTVLAKLDRIEKHYDAHVMKPDYPKFAIPRLEKLYFKKSEKHSQIDTKRWGILMWIMSLGKEIIDQLKKWDVYDSLRIATLYILVKNELLSVEEADGIHITIDNWLGKNVEPSEYEDPLVPRYIRAAHIYNITFSHVRRNFAIAGLLPLRYDSQENEIYLMGRNGTLMAALADTMYISQTSVFDGPNFHQKMVEIGKWSAIKRENAINLFRELRLYADTTERPTDCPWLKLLYSNDIN